MNPTLHVASQPEEPITAQGRAGWIQLAVHLAAVQFYICL